MSMLPKKLLAAVACLLAVACAAPAPPAPPAGTQYVASARGRVYYWVGCDGWHGLAPANLRFYTTAGAARAAGLRPSSQPGCAGPATSAPAASTCTVERVVDGDTLVCDDGVRIRLLLIDAPELSQGPFGAAARAALEALAPMGAELRVELDVQRQDRYRRTLAYLYLADGRMVNEELLRAGLAVVSVHPPNVRHVERLRAAVDSARAARVGLWSTSAFECTPADYRAGRCAS
jgi:endonuclease YncB( thermonuclease family)